MEKNFENLIKELNSIGISLSAERNIDKLLEIILEESIKITGSDGGSIYIKEGEGDSAVLKFKIARNRSRDIHFEEFTLPINRNSISGYVGLSGELLNLKNVRNSEELLGIRYNSSFDEKIGYKTVNMLVIPMKNYEEDTVGVVQLINKKSDSNIILGDISLIESQIVPYTKFEEEIISSLASQAGILIERTMLYDEIQELLRSFIESMVVTIDARDTTTSGHSKRLAGYAIKFLEAVDRVDYGKYKELHFGKNEIREIYYAALLHDIGKIGVKESVLQKSGRLSPEKMEAIEYRVKYARGLLIANAEKADENGKVLIERFEEILTLIKELNNKEFVTDDEEIKLKEIKEIKIKDGEKIIEILTEFEYENLSVKKGNLTNEEREEINSHVVHTYNILKGINWTKELSEIPAIAGSHHEKIDGTGYPNRLKGEEISLQARILAIIDIFEALTARDRPYKPPMPVEKAIKILEFEVKDNHLDKDLFEIFINEKIYELYKEELNKIVKI